MMYAEKDYVEIVDAEGNELPEFTHPVPRAWVGTGLLPRGSRVKKSARGGPSTAAAVKPDSGAVATDASDQGQQGNPS